MSQRAEVLYGVYSRLAGMAILGIGRAKDQAYNSNVLREKDVTSVILQL